MAKQRKRTKPQQKSTEPTVSQQRQAYYEARARRTSLDELELTAVERPRPAPDLRAAPEALDAFDRLMVLYGICRWTAIRGEPPEPEDWQEDEEWPQPEAVEALFGSWDDALSESGVLESSVATLLDKVASAQQGLRTRADELERAQRRLEEDAQRTPELERQMERHKARRDEADLRVREIEGGHERLAAERDAAERRAAELERRVATLEAAPSATPAEPEVETLRGELAAARAEVTRIHDALEQERTEHDHDRRTIAELSRLLARLDAAGAGAGEDASDEPAADDDVPGTVLEAVERAAATSSHLRFAPRAFETAADSPFRRPGLVLRALRQLDELAGRFAAGDMGISLSQAAPQAGITQWKNGVSELARTRWRDEYLVTIDGHEAELGPHIALGSGSGAGFVARIYLHVADGNDGLPRGITVGVVGRHLPDTTT
ncbi:MAG TPA: hypothetical protein VFB41_00085 [Solirubrobacteraceae bacterium]|nr:hypothetical protein [Solirubrobacteraceae bacterium]